MNERDLKSSFVSYSMNIESHSYPLDWFRNIVSCMGIVQLPPDYPGLPKEYHHPVWGMVLELCKVGCFKCYPYLLHDDATDMAANPPTHTCAQ